MTPCGRTGANLKGNLTEQDQAIVAAMGKGKISPDVAGSMLGALATQARIIESDEFEQRVRKLEERAR